MIKRVAAAAAILREQSETKAPLSIEAPFLYKTPDSHLRVRIIH